jgi:hypothetical protein
MLSTIAPPMGLGESLSGTDADGNLTNEDKLGMIHTFPAAVYSGGPNRSKTVLTSKPIVAILMRNISGLTLLPKRLASIALTAGYGTTKNVDGYSVNNNRTGVVLIDPYLPTGGVADDDIFWGIIGGPAPCLVPMTGAGMNQDIVVGQILVAATGTTSGATTSGRISAFTAITADTTLAINVAAGVLGRAMSAKTTHQTTAGQDVLVDWAIRL